MAPEQVYSYMLLDDGENRIGRGLDCHVVLNDPLSSRVHAVVTSDATGSWFIRDAASRNGTFVNGQKVDEAQLIDGCHVKTGTTEFLFSQSEAKPLDVVGQQSGSGTDDCL